MEFRINFFGDGGVGKSAWISNRTGEFLQRTYTATVGVEAHPRFIHTTHGTIFLTLYEYAGDEKYSSKNEPEHADAMVVMFDLTRKNTYTNLGKWFDKCKNGPIFVVGNKSDKEHKVLNPSFPTMTYLQTSAVTGKGLFEPILQTLTGFKDLEIVEE